MFRVSIGSGEDVLKLMVFVGLREYPK
jgi:hypothetical protein